MKSTRNRYSTAVIRLSSVITLVVILLINAVSPAVTLHVTPNVTLNMTSTTYSPPSLLNMVINFFRGGPSSSSSTEVGQPRSMSVLPSRKDIMRQCYGRYGCFSVDHPWYSSHRVVNLFPESPREIHPHFFLYTRENPKDLHLLRDGDRRGLRLSHFDSNK